MPLDKQHFSPGSKNWIQKYFQLVENNVFSIESISENHQKDATFHTLASKTGLIYGIPASFIYFSNVSSETYTNEEKLKLLLFEALLYSYLQDINEPFDKKLFINSLLIFYKEKDNSGWFNKLFKTSEFQKIEKTLSSRISIETTIFESNFWLNYLSNCYIFIDVILYREFLQNRIISLNSVYSDYVSFAIKGIIYISYADKKIDSKEKRLLSHFLSGSKLEKEIKVMMEAFINNGINISEFNLRKFDNSLFSKIIFELGIFINIGAHNLSISEQTMIYDFANFLGLSVQEAQESELLCEAFLLEQKALIAPLYSDSKNYSVFQGFTNKWIRILGRNKDKLVTELQESKELVALIKKSTSKELSKEEKELVKTQFMDILKSIPSIGIFLLPGGALLLPLILKVVPDLIPSSFKENEIDEKKK